MVQVEPAGYAVREVVELLGPDGLGIEIWVPSHNDVLAWIRGNRTTSRTGE